LLLPFPAPAARLELHAAEMTPLMLATNVLLENCAREGDRPFLRLLHLGHEPETYTYRHVLQRACRWRDAYRSHGVDDRGSIVIILKHSLDLYAAFVGALLHGGVPAMFAFPSNKVSEREYFATLVELLGNAGAQLLVTSEDLAGRLRAPAAAVQDLHICTRESLRSCEIDQMSLAEHSRGVASADDVAFLQYSSGTTGLKKGVAISHRALLWQVDEYAKLMQASTHDCIVSWLPLYHDMGLVASFLLPLLKRVPLVAMCPFEWAQRPSLWTDAVTEYRGTLSWQPNFAYNHMVRSISESERQRCDLSSLRALVNCSEPILADTHSRFLDRFAPHGLRRSALAASYAMAENTFAVTSGGIGEPLAEEVIDGDALGRRGRALPVAKHDPNAKTVVSSGRPLAATQIDIVVDGEVVGERQLGEIVLRSPCLLTEYHGNPAATASSLRDGRYFTGDIGYLAGGALYVVGRCKDVVIVGGVNIHPQDVEEIVGAIPGVVPGRCVAFGAPRADLGTEMLVVLAETREEDDVVRRLTRKNIYEALVARVGVVPGVVTVVDHMTLRKSSAGKMSRAINRERFLSGAFTAPDRGAAA
jgi:acyl-CoA synthetase (AMP-forming)/AMP-acid ligase II